MNQIKFDQPQMVRFDWYSLDTSDWIAIISIVAITAPLSIPAIGMLYACHICEKSVDYLVEMFVRVN